MKKLIVGLVLLFVVAASPVFATDIDVEFTIDWGDVDDYNVAPSCLLFDGDELVVTIPLLPVGGNFFYTGTFEDPASRCSSYKIVWDIGEGIDWDPEPCTGGDIWNGIEDDTEASEQ